MTVYQLRDTFGNKLLEREDPAEVRHFIKSRPDQHAREVWILKDYPGDLSDVVPADRFVNPPPPDKP